MRPWVSFIFHLGEFEVARSSIRFGDEQVTVTIPDFPAFQCGIYAEIVPGEPGSAEKWQEIHLCRANGKILSTNRDTFVFEEPEFEEILESDTPDTKRAKFSRNRALRAQALICRVKIAHEPLPRRDHPEGAVCGPCKCWSRERGIEELNNVTHVYSNGTFCMTKEIVNTVCDTHHAPALTVADVGYCSKNHELCADKSPACEHYEPWERAPK